MKSYFAVVMVFVHLSSTVQSQYNHRFGKVPAYRNRGDTNLTPNHRQGWEQPVRDPHEATVRGKETDMGFCEGKQKSGERRVVERGGETDRGMNSNHVQ